jgi:hypothetical protein
MNSRELVSFFRSRLPHNGGDGIGQPGATEADERRWQEKSLNIIPVTIATDDYSRLSIVGAAAACDF